jgi:hypothetical protein
MRGALRVGRAIALPIGIVACVAPAFVGLAQTAYASTTHQAPRCGTFRAEGREYGVYIADGHVKCAVAKDILQAVQSGKGKNVFHGGSDNSWVLYDGWLCPYGNMGEQTCEHSTHPVSRPSQDIAGLSCSVGAGCPEQAAFANE